MDRAMRASRKAVSMCDSAVSGGRARGCVRRKRMWRKHAERKLRASTHACASRNSANRPKPDD
eukprot:1097619-Rhodomonas_salina.1